MAVTVAMIKELRQRTGAGMMECKKALAETNDAKDTKDNADIMTLAIEILRKKGAAVAQKKSGRIAAEGLIVLAHDRSASVLVEVNSETDFVAKDLSFQSFANSVAQAALSNAPADSSPDNEWLTSTKLDSGHSVAAALQALIAKIGENIKIRRIARLDATGGIIGSYLHGAKIGVLVKLSGGTEELSRDIAMHIAASKPLCISEQDVDRVLLAREKEIFTAQAEESGKPPEIITKMVDGRINKFLKENTLLGQPFVKNTEQTVGDLIKEAGVTIMQMARFEVGEGIEKRKDDFVAEVMAQAAS